MINLVKLQLYQRNPTASNGRINTRIWSSHILHSGLQFTVLSFGIFVVTHCILRFVSARIQANDDTISLTSLGFLFRYYIIIFFLLFHVSMFALSQFCFYLCAKGEGDRISVISDLAISSVVKKSSNLFSELFFTSDPFLNFRLRHTCAWGASFKPNYAVFFCSLSPLRKLREKHDRRTNWLTRINHGLNRFWLAI